MLYDGFLQKDYNKVLDYFKIKIEKGFYNPKKRFLNYDKIILYIAEKILKKHNVFLPKEKEQIGDPKVLFLATEVYDSGGHTELLMSMIDTVSPVYENTFFLTGLDRPLSDSAPIKSNKIKEKNTKIVELPLYMDKETKIIEIFNFILKEKFTTIVVAMHMYDVVACAVLGLIKKYTNINVFFVNIGEQYFSLGMNHSDKIWSRLKNGKVICPHIKGKTNIVDIPLLQSNNEVELYPESVINEKKASLGIEDNAFVTLTGALPHKILNAENQEYLNLIRRLLENNSNMVHILMTVPEQIDSDLLKNIFGEYIDRIKVIGFVPNFDLYIQLSNLYIDSFPQGSALTLIDYIKHSKPPVVKINNKEPIRSFEGYVDEAYEYACETVEQMEDKISFLINNNDAYQKACKQVREIYLKKYDLKKLRDLFLENII